MGTLGSNSKMGESPPFQMTPQQPGETNKQTNANMVKLIFVRNGLLINHHLLEVNGQNVVGVKDKAVGVVIEEGGDVITITIIPTYIYNTITNK